LISPFTKHRSCYWRTIRSGTAATVHEAARQRGTRHNVVKTYGVTVTRNYYLGNGVLRSKTYTRVARKFRKGIRKKCWKHSLKIDFFRVADRRRTIEKIPHVVCTTRT
jgi:hypothetical protein